MISRRTKIITLILMVVLGTCMHFVHELLPEGIVSLIAGNVFPVNETSWEHMKMIWYPFLFAGIILSRKTGNRGCFTSFVICSAAAMLMQLGAFSFYESFTGHSVLIIDIIIYFSVMICCILLAYDLSQKEWTGKALPVWIALALIITAGIIYLTYCPGGGYVFLDNEGLEAL